MRASKTGVSRRFAVSALFCMLACMQACVLLSCSRGQTDEKRAELAADTAPALFGEPVRLRNDYATAFSADSYRNGCWLLSAGGIRYLVVPASADAQVRQACADGVSPKDIVIIRQPLTAVYVAASASVALWNAAGALDQVCFTSTRKQDWYVPAALQAIEAGQLRYIGKYNAPDYEALLRAGCSLAVESKMVFHAPQVKEKLESIGIPVFIDCSSAEQNPLGRMEWIRVYGILSGHMQQADDFFERQLHELEPVLGKADGPLPKVAFFYINPNGMAVVRRHDDYLSNMIAMAGGAYAFGDLRQAEKKVSASVTISMEQFYAAASDADYFIYNASIDHPLGSVADLVAKNSLFAGCRAVRNGQVWTTNKYLYQAADCLGLLIRDIHTMLDGGESEMVFLEHVE